MFRKKPTTLFHAADGKNEWLRIYDPQRPQAGKEVAAKAAAGIEENQQERLTAEVGEGLSFPVKAGKIEVRRRRVKGQPIFGRLAEFQLNESIFQTPDAEQYSAILPQQLPVKPTPTHYHGNSRDEG